MSKAGDVNLHECRRADSNAPFKASKNLGPNVNRATSEARPWLSPDGRVLCFGSIEVERDAAGGVKSDAGTRQLWFAVRPSVDAQFGPRQPLGPPPFPTDHYRVHANLSADGTLLLFESKRTDADHELRMSRRVPRQKMARASCRRRPSSLGPGSSRSVGEVPRHDRRDEALRRAKMILIQPGEFPIVSTVEQFAQAQELAKHDGTDEVTQDNFRIGDRERPQHRVVLSQPYFPSATEATVGEFCKFVDDMKYYERAVRIVWLPVRTF